MKFRIRSLMIYIAMISILLTTWHLVPMARCEVLAGIVATHAVEIPTWIYSQKHPGPWSEKAIYGLVAYSAIIVAGAWAISRLFPNLPYVMETWPG